MANAKKEETGTKAFPPLFARFHFQNYADSLYEMGMVNAPLTEGLNFHSLANQRVAESPRRGDEWEITLASTITPFSTWTRTTTSPLTCRFRAARGYSGVGCLKATLLAGIPITTIGCSSAACNITGIDQSVATVAI